MSGDDVLRRAFPDYDDHPEPHIVAPGGWAPLTASDEPARNASTFPDLYLTIRGQVERAVQAAWDRVTNPRS